MKVRVHRTITAELLHRNDLPLEVKTLLNRAAAVRTNAQAPYSHYLVGAAVEDTFGNVYVGCNVERASYTQTTHAEQNAVDSMVAEGGPSRRIARIAIVGAHGSVKITPATLGKRPKDIATKADDLSSVVSPCGHCLQIIWENCGGDPSVPIYGYNSHGHISKISIGDCFPIRFALR